MPKGVKNSGGKKNTFEEVPCIIGIDQSYERTGMAIAINGKVKKVYSIDFKNVKSKTAKRLLLQKKLDKMLNSCLKHYKPEEIVVITERIRTFTNSYDVRPQVIKAHSAMVAYIVDTAYVKGIKTYSVDTRVWKKRILGTSQPTFEPIEGVKNPQKFGSVKKAIELGFEKEMTITRPRKGNKYEFSSYNDDMADAICIALYPFSGYPYSLQMEM